MAKISLRPGVRFQLKGEWFIIRERLLNRQFLVENQTSGGKSTKSLDELEKSLADGELRFEVTGPSRKLNSDGSVPTDHTIADFEILPEQVRAEAWRLFSIIRPLLSWPPAKRTRRNIEKYVRDLRDKLSAQGDLPTPAKDGSPRKGIKRGQALSRSLVERKLRAYLDSGGDLRSLVAEMLNMGNPGQKRLDAETDEVIAGVLDKCEKERHQRTVEDIYLMVIHAITLDNRTRPADKKIEFPSRPTVYNRIHERGAEMLLRRRRSRIEQQALEPVREGPRPTRIMERVEFDGTWLDLIVVDEDDRLPIGRPWFSYALDKYSGYPLGFYVGFEHPGYKTTMSCALHAFSVKPDARVLYGTQHQWLSRGLPELAVVDNGKEYVNRHLNSAFGMLGVILDQCPVKTPWMKASVERYIRTQNSGLVHIMPGTTFSNVVERGDYESHNHACISLSALMKVLHLFWLDYYAEKWHKGVKGIPARLWEKSEREGYIPCFPSSQHELEVLLYWNDTRTLQRHGIEFENIVYQSNDLVKLRTLLSADDRKVEIRVNPSNLSSIFVLDPITKAEWLRFDANDSKGYCQGLSLWKHRIILRYLNNQKKEVDIVALAQAKADIQKIVDEEYVKTRRSKHRKAGARYLAQPEQKQLPASVQSEGTTLAPDARTTSEELTTSSAEPVADVKVPTKSRKRKSSNQASEDPVVQPATKYSASPADNDEPLDTTGWSSDLKLPRNTQSKNTLSSEEK